MTRPAVVFICLVSAIVLGAAGLYLLTLRDSGSDHVITASGKPTKAPSKPKLPFASDKPGPIEKLVAEKSKQGPEGRAGVTAASLAPFLGTWQASANGVTVKMTFYKRHGDLWVKATASAYGQTQNVDNEVGEFSIKGNVMTVSGGTLTLVNGGSILRLWDSSTGATDDFARVS
jgi:hypothetical protein